MKFSVIVPVYNTEAYLEDCMRSVLSQTWPHFEVILVDDGSSDGSGQLCDRYASGHPGKITAVHTENQGPFPARIRGIRESRGDALVFLDSDDCLRKDALELLARCFEEEHCDMVLYDTEECAAFGSRRIAHPFPDEVMFEGESRKKLFRMLTESQIPNSLCLKAVKRSCAVLPEDMSAFNHVRHGEDLLLSAYLITNCQKIGYLNRGLYHYRVRAGSLVHTFSVRRAESIKTVHREMERFLDIWGMPELKLRHNARKVRGWVQNLVMLLASKDTFPREEYWKLLKTMAEDPYFTEAYAAMDTSCLSAKQRLLAELLYRKQYGLLDMLAWVRSRKK